MSGEGSEALYTRARVAIEEWSQSLVCATEATRVAREKEAVYKDALRAMRDRIVELAQGEAPNAITETARREERGA